MRVNEGWGSRGDKGSGNTVNDGRGNRRTGNERRENSESDGK